MFGIIHHNSNLEAEATGNRTIERVCRRIGRASGLPSLRIHKTITSWQQEIMNSIIEYAAESRVF